MDLHKAKIQLEKINSLCKSMTADPANISSIEKDLMLSYIRQLYESFLDLTPQAHQQSKAGDVEIIKSSPKISTNKPEPLIEKKPTPQAAPRLAPPTYYDNAEDERPAPAPSPPPPPPKVVEEKPKPSPVPPPAPIVTAPTSVDTELEDLFAFGTAKELSEKLGELPVTDIRKAMGLNERVFTVNELFGGDQAAFDETVNALNRLTNFEEAKHYLIINVAGKYGWASKEKKSKAKTFIKLVKRRYN